MRRRWKDLEWIERFGYTVGAGMLATIAALVLAMFLNGCDLDLNDPGPTLPPLTTSVRPAEAPREPRAPSTPNDGVRGSEGP